MTEITDYVRLLEQFHQIVLQGPPGTGKTYTAKEITKRLIGDDAFNSAQGERWDIVQFHPSYNYEDFVRGIQIQPEDGKVAYNSDDRILVKMAKRAEKSKDPHALIIDEINRANVASVLGELIYALEYRGKKVKTPYTVDGSADIILPENLYIIGTMNTADRTIGHLDYAVRRRFAFETLLPNGAIVSRESKAENAKQWFDRVAKFFQKDGGYLSPDFYYEDVAIGHTYFLAKNNSELRAQILYQVIPILWEYLKDGVLSPEAEEKIKELKDELKEEMKNDDPPAIKKSSSDKPSDAPSEGRSRKNYRIYENLQTLAKVLPAMETEGIKTSLRAIKKFIADHPQDYEYLGDKSLIGQLRHAVLDFSVGDELQSPICTSLTSTTVATWSKWRGKFIKAGVADRYPASALREMISNAVRSVSKQMPSKIPENEVAYYFRLMQKAAEEVADPTSE